MHSVTMRRGHMADLKFLIWRSRCRSMHEISLSHQMIIRSYADQARGIHETNSAHYELTQSTLKPWKVGPLTDNSDFSVGRLSWTCRERNSESTFASHAKDDRTWKLDIDAKICAAKVCLCMRACVQMCGPEMGCSQNLYCTRLQPPP